MTGSSSDKDRVGKAHAQAQAGRAGTQALVTGCICAVLLKDVSDEVGR